jgi:hypothetical protein
MKEPYRKGVAHHPDPESCAGGRKAAGEALTGAHVGWVWSSEIYLLFRVPTLCSRAEGHIAGGERAMSPADPAESETPGMRGNSERENRETPGTPPAGGGPVGEGYEP